MIDIRKTLIQIEEVFHEFGPKPAKPWKLGAIACVIANPFAGRYEPNIQPFMEELKPLGLDLSRKLLAAMGGDAKSIEGFGKGAIIGTAGELEHGALWHAPGGYVMREVLNNAKAIVPSGKKVGGPGTRLDVPITHINASYVRSHFTSIEVGMNDAPRPGEMIVILAMTTGARIHDRAGGLKASEIKGEDGLR